MSQAKITRIDNQRQYDLVRQMRMELHNADLITDEEYSELAQDHPAVARLEDYDGVRAQISALQAEAARWKKAIEGLTPLGSEFVDDPEACAAHIRDRYNPLHTFKELRAEIARLTAQQEMLREPLSARHREEYLLTIHMMEKNYRELVAKYEANKLYLDAIAEALGLDKAYLPDQLAGMVRELQQQLIGANSSASDVAHQNDGDSNDEEAPTNSQREAFAWIYQWAGAMDAPASILDNLSALASGEPVPHEWQYPAMPDENAALTEQLAAARADGERLDWWTTHNDDVVYFGNDEAGGWQIDIISGKTFYADTPREAIDQARANADREKQE